jgi:hypothetical protein
MRLCLAPRPESTNHDLTLKQVSNMHASKLYAIAIALIVMLLSIPSRSALGDFTPLMAADATQPFTDPADNFEIVLRGDQTTHIPGQNVNPFASPNSFNSQFDPATNTTIVRFAGPQISSDAPNRHTAGFAINAQIAGQGTVSVDPGLVDGYWTTNPLIDGHLPQQDLSIVYTAATATAVVTVSNDPDTFKLFSVGYQVTNAPFALTSLNRATLPPGSFIASGIPDGTTLIPGSSVSFTITGIALGQYITVFADAQFSGPSAGNPYHDLSGRWLEIQAVPEPGSLALMLTGVVVVFGGARARSLGRGTSARSGTERPSSYLT